jgi:hypothetical protein
MDDFGTVDEGQFGERKNALSVERWLEGEVKAGKALDRGKPRQGERRLYASVLAHRELLDEKLIERFDAIDLALLDAPQGSIERFQGAWHPQRHQACS